MKSIEPSQSINSTFSSFPNFKIFHRKSFRELNRNHRNIQTNENNVQLLKYY